MFLKVKQKFIASLLLTVCCTLGALPLCSTTIVVYITPKFVVMGADSKGVFTSVASRAETSSIVSKIYQRNKIYFSLAGVTINKIRNLDLPFTIDKELRNFTIWTEVNTRIKNEVSRSLLAYASYMKANNKDLFLKDLAASDYFSSVVLISIRNNKPYVHLFGFKITDGSVLKITTEEIDYGRGEVKDAVYYLGQKLAINKYMDTVNSVSGSPEKFVEKLIQLQVKSTPSLVGAPIDILRLTNTGATWIKRKKGTPVVLR